MAPFCFEVAWPLLWRFISIYSFLYDKVVQYRISSKYLFWKGPGKNAEYFYHNLNSDHVTNQNILGLKNSSNRGGWHFYTEPHLFQNPLCDLWLPCPFWSKNNERFTSNAPFSVSWLKWPKKDPTSKKYPLEGVTGGGNSFYSSNSELFESGAFHEL